MASVSGPRDPTESSQRLRRARSARPGALARRRKTARSRPGRRRARQLDAELCRRTVVSLLHRRLAAKLAQFARTLGLRLVFLKGAALDLMGRIRPGSRPMGDIDVLVSDKDARELHAFLTRHGYEESGQPAPRHHLPRLVHVSGVVVEIHHRLRGIRGLEPDATAEDCFALEGCEVVEALGDSSFVPTPALLLAHPLAHALDQHAMTPEAYWPFRIVADLQDLGVLEGGAGAGLRGRPDVGRSLGERA